MSSSIFARDLLLVVNDVWADMALARLLGQVPETVDSYMDVLDLAAGRPFIQREVSTVYAQLLVSQQREDGSWEIEPRRWHAADFDHRLARVLERTHAEIAAALRDLPRKPFDLVYFGGWDREVEAALRAAKREPGGPHREITVVTMPEMPTTGDRSFRWMDAVVDLDAFPSLALSRHPRRNGESVSGGEGRRITELDPEATVDLHVSGTGRCSRVMRMGKKPREEGAGGRLGRCGLIGRGCRLVR